ncbi:MAG TPA: NrfD/PsrC family molybdoenzyme membrane anchor subunit [Devosia sp.]|nr:NrfD/PsrC family molybdoenzyme membrane anchor subunit [Devosia sp.]
MSDTAPVLRGRPSAPQIAAKISAIVLGPKLPRRFWLGFAFFFALALIFLFCITLLLTQGIGILGLNIPAAWGFPITNTVWWIGIGHAGTLISAVLLLLRQDWRASINRFAEAMTLLAASMAGLFPILHLGRPQYFYWLLPLPVTHMPWPQWRSPLVWDFFAIATYLIVSLLFWYMGLLPDVAVLRDRAKSRAAQISYGLLALGWRGSARHWARYERGYILLAALAAPLVVSVHSVVSLDFTSAITPGYHSTIFPPYFVAGALYSGFAMVLTIAVPLRQFFDLGDFITLKHFDNAGKIMLAAGALVAYGYLNEAFFAWYSGDEFHRYAMWARMFGNYGWTFWIMIACNVGTLQLLWFRRVRTSPWLLFALALIINVGMWLERYVIVVSSLTRDFLPSSWHEVTPNWVDFGLLFGSAGMFFALIFIFIRLLPLMTIFEVEELRHDLKAAG